MDLELLTKPSITIKADENDLFRKVQGRVVVVPRNPDPRWLAGTYKAIAKEMEVVQKYIRSGKYFGVENVQETGAEAKVKLKNTLKHFEMAQKGYPKRLFPSFLSWQRKDKLPEFMTMSWDSRDFSLTVIPDLTGGMVECDFRTDPYLHPLLAMQYLPVVEHLAKIARSERSDVTIAARFAGSIPQVTKQRMELAVASGCFEQFYIAAEAPKWDIHKIVRARTDPIVFGQVRMETGIIDQFYMIDIFDPTPIEVAAAEQFGLDPYRPSK